MLLQYNTYVYNYGMQTCQHVVAGNLEHDGRLEIVKIMLTKKGGLQTFIAIDAFDLNSLDFPCFLGTFTGYMSQF